MSTALTETSDPALTALLEALKPYENEHPGALVEGYRQGEHLISIRVTDSAFAGMDRVERHETIWNRYFADRSGELLNELGLLVLVTPREAKTWGASLAFDAEAPRSS